MSVVLKVGLSKKRLTAHGDISGYTLASASVGTLLARTRIKHIPVYGWGVVPKGTFYPIIVAVDGSGRIVAAAMGTKRFKTTVKGGVGSIRRLSLALTSAKPVTFGDGAEFVG